MGGERTTADQAMLAHVNMGVKRAAAHPLRLGVASAIKERLRCDEDTEDGQFTPDERRRARGCEPGTPRQFSLMCPSASRCPRPAQHPCVDLI